MIDGYSNTSFEEQQALAVHLQTEAIAPDGTTIVVDEGIAPLLRALWSLGYNTRFSCQGGDRDNFYNLSPEDEESAEGYIFFEAEEMALSVYGVIYSMFPVEEYPLYHIDSRAILRFSPQAITMFEYALRHFNGDASFGSEDIEKCLNNVAFPDETEAERRLRTHLLELLGFPE